MNFFVNSPAYFTKEHGVINAVYQYQCYLSRHVNIQNYTQLLDSIGISPIIAPFDLYASNSWTETDYVSKKYRLATISLRMNYEVFISASTDDKIKMLSDNIISSLRCVKKKLGTSFDMQFCEKQITELTTRYFEEYRSQEN